MSSVHTYPNTIETSRDEVLERAKKRNPVSEEELAAEQVVQRVQARYDDLQRRIASKMVDIGQREGYHFGVALQPHEFDGEAVEIEQDYTRALSKFNKLRSARHARIRAEVDTENAKAAAKAQAEWQRRRGQ